MKHIDSFFQLIREAFSDKAFLSAEKDREKNPDEVSGAVDTEVLPVAEQETTEEIPAVKQEEHNFGVIYQIIVGVVLLGLIVWGLVAFWPKAEEKQPPVDTAQTVDKPVVTTPSCDPRYVVIDYASVDNPGGKFLSPETLAVNAIDPELSLDDQIAELIEGAGHSPELLMNGLSRLKIEYDRNQLVTDGCYTSYGISKIGELTGKIKAENTVKKSETIPEGACQGSMAGGSLSINCPSWNPWDKMITIIDAEGNEWLVRNWCANPVSRPEPKPVPPPPPAGRTVKSGTSSLGSAPVGGGYQDNPGPGPRQPVEPTPGGNGDLTPPPPVIVPPTPPAPTPPSPEPAAPTPDAPATGQAPE